MRTKAFSFFISTLLIFMSIESKSENYKRFDYDTIKIKTNNNTEFIIVIEDYKDIEKLNFEIEKIMRSLDEVFKKIEDETDNLDSVLNVTVKNIDRNLQIQIDGIDNNESKNVDLEFNVDPEIKIKEQKLHFFATYDFGFNNYMEDYVFPGDNNAQWTVKPWGSWYVGFGSGLRWYVAKPLSFDLSANLSWYNFKYQDKSTRVIKTDDGVEFEKEELERKYIKSKTTVPFINFSFTPIVHFGKKNTGVNHSMFRFGAGIYAGYRIGGHVKYVYEIDNVEVKYHNKDNYFFSSYRYGIKAIFGVSDVNIFATYDLSTLYAQGRGPWLNPIVIGFNWTF